MKLACVLVLALAQDDEARARIADFNKAKAKAKSDDDLKSALDALASLKHPKILKELAGYLKSGSDIIKIAVAKMIAEYKGDKAAADELALVLPAEAARAKKNELGDDAGHETGAAILRAIGKIGVRDSAGKIHSSLEHPNTELAKAAVEAAGELGNLDSVDPLIRLLIELQRSAQLATAPRTNNVKPAPGSVPAMTKIPGRPAAAPVKEDKEAREAVNRANTLEPSIQAALQKITGNNSTQTGVEWSDWWAKNKADLKKPKK